MGKRTGMHRVYLIMVGLLFLDLYQSIFTPTRTLVGSL